MAAAGIASLVLLLSASAIVLSIKDGQIVSQCDYPGIVAVVIPDNGAIICNGVRSKGILYVPELCGAAIGDILTKFPLVLVYGDGTKNLTIPVNSTGTFADGIFQMPITEPMDPDCNSEATLFDSSMDISNNSCELAGYGAEQLAGKIYDGTLKAAPLTKSTSVQCCKVIFNSLTKSQQGVILNKQAPLNCVASSGAGCGLGDLGAPVYCRNSAGEPVVVGLAASFPCENEGTFVIYDLTKSDSGFKFGISA
ncbi:unnamed protein product [Candidula unifasciata]|uniref:Uncharacterized protein n=1 Tax=Candidula unifasciata TaxID=100452 RepID=A0A8S3ZHQ2_9EUPU|nr:unnamed protein product [Candidula unifasciata]